MFTSQLPANVVKELLPGQRFYNMPIFILSAAKTMRMLSRHILPKNASIFTCSHRGLKSFPGRKTLRPLE